MPWQSKGLGERSTDYRLLARECGVSIGNSGVTGDVGLLRLVFDTVALRPESGVVVPRQFTERGGAA